MIAKRRWKRYPKYKDSGVEWLGEVPEQWRLVRLRFSAFINPPKTEVSHIQSDTQVSFVPMEAVGEYGGINLTQSKKIAEVFNGYTYFRENDVLVAKITPCFENGKGAIAEDLESGIGFGTTELHVIRPNEELDRVYLFYFTISHPFRKIGASHMYGAGGQKRISPDFVSNFRIPTPPVQSQKQIITFLVHINRKINILISKKHRQIELLEEKRAAVISHAVTKGLIPGAKMRDSGIEWLGEIPEHWDVGKTKYYAKLKTGHTPSRQHPVYWDNCTIPWFSLADVWQLRDGRRKYVNNTKERISKLGLANSSAELLPAQTVIVSRTASVGFSGIISKPMATTQDFVNWICGAQIMPEYLLFVFRSMKHEFSRLTMGSTHKTIYMPDASSFSTPIPPIDEQQQIVREINSRIKSLDDLKDRVTKSITFLKEYRTALITAAVTGKIDVREEAA